MLSSMRRYNVELLTEEMLDEINEAVVSYGHSVKKKPPGEETIINLKVDGKMNFVTITRVKAMSKT